MKIGSFLLLSILFALHGNAQKDIANSKDYDAFGRLPDYYITKYTEKEFDAHEFYYNTKKHIHEGRKYVIEYRHKNYATSGFQFPTRLQILRNHSNAIKNAGGQILFERYNHEHGYYSYTTTNDSTVWIQVKTSKNGSSYSLYIIEEEAMKQDLVIEADLIKNALEVEGKIAIYGIYFDTGKAIIKEASKPALAEIAKYLKSNPEIKCWIVGHTDSKGSFEINSALALSRAKAVKNYLQEIHTIAANRLFAEGVGPLAPMASNASEEGRRKNRRVELVKK